jgi:hypothetical protein
MELLAVIHKDLGDMPMRSLVKKAVQVGEMDLCIISLLHECTL